MFQPKAGSFDAKPSELLRNAGLFSRLDVMFGRVRRTQSTALKRLVKNSKALRTNPNIPVQKGHGFLQTDAEVPRFEKISFRRCVHLLPVIVQSRSVRTIL